MENGYHEVRACVNFRRIRSVDIVNIGIPLYLLALLFLVLLMIAFIGLVIYTSRNKTVQKKRRTSEKVARKRVKK